MISSAVFGRYARALADISLESGVDAQVAQDVATYREMFRSVPDLAVALDSPAVPREAKKKILEELMRLHPVGETTGNFLRVLLDNNRIRYFAEIHDAFTRVVNERRGIMSALVTTAVPLGQEEISRLKESLTRATGKSVDLEMQTHPGLLGGLVVQLGSTVYDGSIRKQLEQMRERLKAR